MVDYKSLSLVPVVANAAIAVSEDITNFITKARASGIIQRSQLELLKAQTEKVLTEARSSHICDVISTNLEQIAKTQELIDKLEKQGRLHGISLKMAMDQLYDLNDMLRHNLRKLKFREWR